MVTCSWDKHIRVFNVGDEADRTIHDPHGDGRGEEKAPSRIFPDDRRLRLAQEAQERRGAAGEKGADSSEVHTADILAIVHCGNQQVNALHGDGGELSAGRRPLAGNNIVYIFARGVNCEHITKTYCVHCVCVFTNLWHGTDERFHACSSFNMRCHTSGYIM